MTTNMTNKEELNKRNELDRRSASEIMNGFFHGKDLFSLEEDEKGNNPLIAKDWSPSTKNSGQMLEVIRAMNKLGFLIGVEFGLSNIGVGVYKDGELIHHMVEGNGNVNQTILECCLIALGKKKE